jgi:hypothetical protein
VCKSSKTLAPLTKQKNVLLEIISEGYFDDLRAFANKISTWLAML